MDNTKPNETDHMQHNKMDHSAMGMEMHEKHKLDAMTDHGSNDDD